MKRYELSADLSIRLTVALVGEEMACSLVGVRGTSNEEDLGRLNGAPPEG